jgi:hypothetical protein
MRYDNDPKAIKRDMRKWEIRVLAESIGVFIVVTASILGIIAIVKAVF